METVRQLSDVLTSVSRILALHGQGASRTSSQPVTSHQNAEELGDTSVLRILDASIRQLEVLRAEALEIQPHIRSQSIFHSDPVPSFQIDNTSPSESPGSSRDALVSTELTTGNAPSRSRTKAVAAKVCSSRPGPSTFQYRHTEQCSPNQKQRHGHSGMPNASTATIRRNHRPPRSSIEARLQDHVNVDVRTSNIDNSSFNGKESSTLDPGEIFVLDGEGNVVSDAGGSSGNGAINSSNGDILEDEHGSRRSDARIEARGIHRRDRVDMSNVRRGRITEGVWTSTARPQQHRSVRPTSSAAVPSSPGPRALRGIASGRALDGIGRSHGSYTETIREYKVHKPKQNPLLRRPLVVNGCVPTYVKHFSGYDRRSPEA